MKKMSLILCFVFLVSCASGYRPVGSTLCITKVPEKLNAIMNFLLYQDPIPAGNSLPSDVIDINLKRDICHVQKMAREAKDGNDGYFLYYSKNRACYLLGRIMLPNSFSLHCPEVKHDLEILMGKINLP